MTWQIILAIVPLLWAAVSGVATAVIGWKTDAAWAALVRDNPHRAACIELLRKVGLDSPGAWRVLRAIVNRPTPPSSPSALSGTAVSVPPPVTKPDVNEYGWLPVFGWVFIALLMTLGCSATMQQREQKVVLDVKTFAVLDVEKVPCLLLNAPWPITVDGVLTDLDKCGMVHQFQQVVSDFLSGKSVKLSSGATLRVMLPMKADAGT